ncbi:MAG: alpha/beta hydrolase [Pseudomonadota bacterium]
MKRRTFLTGTAVTFLTTACAAPRPTPEPRAEAAYPPIGQIVDTRFGKVHLTDQGRGDGPPVILIHGASGNVRDWTHSITSRLSARHRVIAMDRPGFGYSERPDVDGSWRPAMQAEQLREAAAKIGAENPIIVGHSWGAGVALAWALDAPDDVTGVVSVSGVTMPWGGLAPALNALGFGSVIAGLYNRRMTRSAENGGVQRFVERAFRPQMPPPGYLDYVGAPLALREKTLNANGADLANTNPAISEVAGRYGELRLPIEVMHGDADWLLGIEQHGQEFVAAVPSARLTPLPAVGHMAHHARTDVLASLIQRMA